MKKHRSNWSQGNPAFPAWALETAAGQVIARRNHPLIRQGERMCQGWDIWLDGTFVGTLGSRRFAELAGFSRTGLLRAVQPACCGRHRNFPGTDLTFPMLKGGLRPNAGRKLLGLARRVGLNTTIAARTLELIDERRRTRSRGQSLDDLLQRDAPQPDAAS
jgi:hypothetical protein